MIVFYRALNTLKNLIELSILLRIILSLLNVRLDNFLGEIVFTMTEPILSPSRKLLERLNINTGIFDFSPIVAILLLRIIFSIIGRMIFF